MFKLILKSFLLQQDSKDSAAVSVGEELMLEHQHVAQQLLGDVKLGALLGWGSFGRVYKGLWGGAQVINTTQFGFYSTIQIQST